MLRDPDPLAAFERAVMPHLDAAYHLARWLTRNDHDAADVVQEAYLRAWKSFGRFQGGDGRGWLLATVRNTCYTWLQRNRGFRPLADPEAAPAGSADDPAELALRAEDRAALHEALAELPVEFREVIVLRDLEGLAYKAIAEIADVPLGTVMSRLARARERLRHLLARRWKKE